MTPFHPLTLVALLAAAATAFAAANAPTPSGLPYPIVDTAQDRCFSDTREIPFPQQGQPWNGQDAQYTGLVPTYRDNGDGTVSDLNTGLMWVQQPDYAHKRPWREAQVGASTCRVGGYDDWRLPSIKELYSLIDFRGHSARTPADSVPYLDTRAFAFAYGDPAVGDRLIDSQFASSTVYVGSDGRERGGKVFGVNFADGRIKGYDLKARGKEKTFVALYVRGNPAYGQNNFLDNGDGTVTDRATGLMWDKAGSSQPMTWQEALHYAENLELAGHHDWRLPNAKELQSIVDYTRAPDAPARRGPAIDPVFQTPAAQPWYWTSTTHLEGRTGTAAVYIAFGQATGIINGQVRDVHGAGAQRSDPKSGDPARYAGGRGPQGDEVRIFNYVRCVRGGALPAAPNPPTRSSGGTASGRE